MKKLLAIFAVLSLAFLASCGENKDWENKKGGEDNTNVTKDVTDENKWEEKKEDNTEKEVSGNSCDKIISYTECSSKKAGVDEETIKTTVEQAKKWYDALGDKAEETCKAAIDQMKKGPLVEGCSL